MKEEELRVFTHEQATVSERRRMPRGITEHAHFRNRPHYVFNVPEWMLPKNGVHMWRTITASIVWGICGKMADMPEYGGTK